MKKKTILLQDPTTFNVYELKVNGIKRRIIIIGEIHDIVSCEYSQQDKSIQFLSIADFISEYHRSIGNDQTLDIFSESFHVGKKKLGWLPTLHYLVYLSTHLDDARALAYIRKRLDACSPKFSFSLYDCPEHLRVHLCDVRFVKEMDYAFKRNDRRECMVDTLFKIGLSYTDQDKIPRVSYALLELVIFVKNFLFEKDSDEYHMGMSAYIIKETKIQKQIDNIPSPVMRKRLQKWAHDSYDIAISNARKKFLQFQKTRGKDLRSINRLDYVSEECIKTFVDLISLPILYVISVYMDMYLSGRLLRQFSDHSYAENSIVYVGEYHAKQYRALMKLLGAKEIFARSSMKKDCSYTSCVDISKFYFSQIRKKK